MTPNPKLAAVGAAAVWMAATWSQPETPPDSLIGLSVPCKVALVAPEQAGKLVDMSLRDGDNVAEGDVLFRMNSRLEELEVERLQAIADSDVFERRAKMTLQFAKDQADRVRNLRAEDISSVSDLQEEEHELAMAELAVEQAALDKLQAANQLMQAKERLAQRTVRSPFSGEITARYKGTGEAVEKFVPVVEVMSLDPLWIEFECPFQLQHLYHKGSTVVVSPARRPNDTRTATIEYISPKATASSHSFTIRATVSNKDNKDKNLQWKAGLKMNVEANLQGPPSKPGK